MRTLRSAGLWALLAIGVMLAGCAQTNSASAGASQEGPFPSCIGQNATADCYGGGP